VLNLVVNLLKTANDSDKILLRGGRQWHLPMYMCGIPKQEIDGFRRKKLRKRILMERYLPIAAILCVNCVRKMFALLRPV